MTLEEQRVLREADARHARMDKKIETLLEMMARRDVQLQQDSEHIRALLRIAEMHERRLTDLEGGEPEG